VNTALELSGLPPIPFHFWGFLPRDNKKNEVFQKLQTIKGTHLFFEGVSRVEQTLMELTKILPELSFCVARELTKTYQQVYRFKGANFDPKQLTYKGEFVICVYQDKENLGSNKLNSLAEEILSSGAKPKKSQHFFLKS
jgi:16S rRNA (cytidine1402-2'-O)-methyltransferase